MIKYLVIFHLSLLTVIVLILLFWTIHFILVLPPWDHRDSLSILRQWTSDNIQITLRLR